MFVIKVRTIEGNKLIFHVERYEFDGGFVVFTDSRTQKVKRFHGSNCEIEEVLC